MSRVPQQCFGVLFVTLAAGIAHQFELQAPWCLEINPSRACRRTALDGVGLTHDLDAVVPEMLERSVEIIDIERDVVTANVAVAGRRRTLVRRFILEDLEIHSTTAAQEAIAHAGIRMNIELAAHDLRIGDDGAAVEHEFASNDIGEEQHGLFEIGNGDADMLAPLQTRQANGLSG